MSKKQSTILVTWYCSRKSRVVKSVRLYPSQLFLCRVGFQGSRQISSFNSFLSSPVLTLSNFWTTPWFLDPFLCLFMNLTFEQTNQTVRPTHYEVQDISSKEIKSQTCKACNFLDPVENIRPIKCYTAIPSRHCALIGTRYSTRPKLQTWYIIQTFRVFKFHYWTIFSE